MSALKLQIKFRRLIMSFNNEKDMRICPYCNREVERSEMDFTRDCHGITFRLVCFSCWDKLMKKGYDGEYYSELDECIDCDY